MTTVPTATCEYNDHRGTSRLDRLQYAKVEFTSDVETIVASMLR